MHFDPCPPHLVIDRQAQHGVFDAVPAHPDLKPLRGLRGLGRFKVWHHLMIDTPQLRGTIAMVDLGYLSTAWFWALPSDGEAFELSMRSPRCRMALARGTTGQHSTARGPQLSIKLTHIGPKRLSLVARGRGQYLGLELNGHASKALAVCLPIGSNGAMYSQKMPMDLRAEAVINGQPRFLKGLAMLDTHQAYYPAQTNWRWATAAWRDGCQTVAFNLTQNQAQEPQRYNECALWVGDRIERLPLPQFEVPDDPLRPWTIGSEDGRVDLRFQPIDLRRDDTRIGPLKIWYVQPFGRFSGAIVDASGQPHPVLAWGVCEDHRAQW